MGTVNTALIEHLATPGQHLIYRDLSSNSASDSRRKCKSRQSLTCPVRALLLSGLARLRLLHTPPQDIVRLEPEVLQWLRDFGPGYLSWINAHQLSWLLPEFPAHISSSCSSVSAGMSE